jgi:hypothetical protein
MRSAIVDRVRADRRTADLADALAGANSTRPSTSPRREADARRDPALAGRRPLCDDQHRAAWVREIAAPAREPTTRAAWPEPADATTGRDMARCARGRAAEARRAALPPRGCILMVNGPRDPTAGSNASHPCSTAAR